MVGSLSTIVSTAVSGSPMLAPPVTFPKLTINCSSASLSLSSMMSTVKVLSVASSSAQFRVPEASV
ncbi:hypothetical protein THIOM_004549 [Candidatus Thiomargarita nelsonii]|uniref:Uncharacterized protein n=1 Tax=Candidatus Thiomargarita nelsonii TaxID=1003181 RepID=A0A176RVK8_9GAMM|nr:hypothetical protein THIOM_004549 [Candidatus Thiomargarita nelsonii]